MGFAVGGGAFDPQNRRFPARPAPGDKDKFWSPHVTLTLNWVPEGSLAGICWVGFWGLGGPWGL